MTDTHDPASVVGPPQKEAVRPPIQQSLVKALAHPLRIRILDALHLRPMSASKLSLLFRVPLGNVSYHVGILEKLGAIELVRSRQVRGATEHFFATSPRAMIGGESWRRAPLAMMPGVTNAAIGTFIERMAAAVDAGTIERRDDTTLDWMPLRVDRPGWRETVKIMDRARRELLEVHEVCRDRLDEADGIPVIAGLAAFEMPPPVDTAGDVG